MKKKKHYFIKRPAVSRNDVLSQAIKDCLDTMYRASYPSISYDGLCEKSRVVSEISEGKEKSDTHVMDQHYLPEELFTFILEDYIDAYKFKSDLPDTIEILKKYCKEPMADECRVPADGSPSYEGYGRLEPMAEEHYRETEKYLDMANNFYNWDRDEIAFKFNVANAAPNTSRKTVEKFYQEHGQPNFKLPEDSYWVNPWSDDYDEDAYSDEDFVNT